MNKKTAIIIGAGPAGLTAAFELLEKTNTYKKQDGSQGEEVCFVDCQMFGKRAEVINKYLHKGDQLFVEGRLKFDSWQGQDGSKRSKLRVFVENFEFVGGGQRNSGGGGGGQQGGGQAPNNNAGGGGQGADNMPYNPTDDIPF